MRTGVDIACASRARPVHFFLPGGREIRVAPPTLDQSIECLLLDPEPGSAETPLEELVRLRRQAAVLLGTCHASLTDELDQWQVGEIVRALYLAAAGLDAEGFIEWQRAQRDAGSAMDTLQAIESLERITIELAAALRQRPAEVGGMPLADALALRDRLRLEREREEKFLAALHGKELR